MTKLKESEENIENRKDKLEKGDGKTQIQKDAGVPLSSDLIRQAVPKHMRARISDEIINNINKVITDTDERENFRENFISYASVMADGKYKMESYISAVRYVGFKLLGNTNTLAWTKTFPERYEQFIRAGHKDSELSPHVVAYNKTVLVNKILEQTLVPSYILNQDLYQEALNVQADLMRNAKSEHVKTDAANSLLTQLKQPEIKKIELDIGVKEDSSIEELRQVTMRLAAQQRLSLESGANTPIELAESKIHTIKDEENAKNGNSVENIVDAEIIE